MFTYLVRLESCINLWITTQDIRDLLYVQLCILRTLYIFVKTTSNIIQIQQAGCAWSELRSTSEWLVDLFAAFDIIDPLPLYPIVWNRWYGSVLNSNLFFHSPMTLTCLLFSWNNFLTCERHVVELRHHNSYSSSSSIIVVVVVNNASVNFKSSIPPSHKQNLATWLCFDNLN